MELPASLKLPYPPYLWTIVRRTAVTWIVVRLLLLGVLWLLAGRSAALHQPTWGIPSLLVWLDRRNSHEQLLHANLGTTELWFWAASLLTASLLDVLANIALPP